jgi:hypothetical protein
MTAAERVDSWACWFVSGEAGLVAASAPTIDMAPGPPATARRAVARIRLTRVAVALQPQHAPRVELGTY